MSESLSNAMSKRLNMKETSLSDIAQLIAIINSRNDFIRHLRPYETSSESSLNDWIEECNNKIKLILNL